MIEIDSVEVTSLTHYTISFDEFGTPVATSLASTPAEDIAGELPHDWDEVFWDWQPRFDPDGAWVQRVDDRREYLWQEVKRTRDIEASKPLSVSLGESSFIIQTDAESVWALQQRYTRMTRPGAPVETNWTDISNIPQTLTVEELGSILDAIDERSDLLHIWSQGVRDQIMDPDNDTLEKLNGISVTYGGEE